MAAIRYVTNGTYLEIINELLQKEASDDMKPLKERVEKLVPMLEKAVEKVKAAGNQDVHDFLARRLYDMTADIVMSLLIIGDASAAPELFAKSANVYVRMAEEEVIGKAAYVEAFNADDLVDFRAVEPEEEEEK